MSSHSVRCIIFDLDGVLVRSGDCHLVAFKEVFARYDIHDFDYAANSGRRTDDVIADVFRRAGIAADLSTVSAVARDKSRRAYQLFADSKPLAEGCREVLDELAGRYRLALATSGSRARLEAFLDLVDGRSVFDSVLSGDDVIHGKPHPEIYQRTMDTLRTQPSACVVVEDAVAGVQAACQAGATVVACLGSCPESALRRAGATRIISRLPELPPLLASL